MTTRRAALTAETVKTWTVMSIPGREDDGRDDLWMARNRLNGDSVACSTRGEAADVARQMNSR